LLRLQRMGIHVPLSQPSGKSRDRVVGGVHVSTKIGAICYSFYIPHSKFYIKKASPYQEAGFRLFLHQINYLLYNAYASEISRV
jgi:hypothetical protein